MATSEKDKKKCPKNIVKKKIVIFLGMTALYHMIVPKKRQNVQNPKKCPKNIVRQFFAFKLFCYWL